jgi:hypothetical protein
MTQTTAAATPIAAHARATTGPVEPEPDVVAVA